jgi:hypothetical protein
MEAKPVPARVTAKCSGRIGVPANPPALFHRMELSSAAATAA